MLIVVNPAVYYSRTAPADLYSFTSAESSLMPGPIPCGFQFGPGPNGPYTEAKLYIATRPKINTRKMP